MPKLWNQTIEAHRRDVRDAILEATAALVAEHGLRGVTMSEVADRAGIGRATLYKYFSDIEAILLTWHEQKVAEHLSAIAAARDRSDNPRAQLEAVLTEWADVVRSRGGHQPQLAAMLHRHSHVGEARGQLHSLVRDVIVRGVSAGVVRGDVAPRELAGFSLSALEAAGAAESNAAARRLVTVVLDGLRPPATQPRHRRQRHAST